MKKVLIAIDYNPVSEKVTNAGYELAQSLNAEVCLIHVIDDVGFYGSQFPTFMGYDGYTGMGPDFDVALEMRSIAEEFLEKAKSHLKDENVRTHLAEGNTVKSIMNYVEEWGADVLVLGTHSHSVLEKIFLGTVAEKIVEKTTIPLYLVPVKK
jgi:nucleotide-binding universal stress UspA family protein